MKFTNRIFSTAAAVIAVTAVFFAPVASASTGNISIPVDTVVRGDAGSTHTIKTVQVKNGDYNVTVTSKNQESVHPNSDLIVRSGNSAVTVADVERKEFTTATATGVLNVANGAAQVQVKLGKDKVFSGGMDVTLKPVVKNVTVCRPGTGVITIKETDKKPTDLPKDHADCQPKPGTVKVCDPKTGKVIEVKETEKSQFEAIDNEACQEKPVEQPEEQPVKPVELPQTGAADALLKLTGAGLIAASAVAFYRSRQ